MKKEDYSYALFFGHLAVEKILKAVYVVRKGEHAPYLHNLEKLAALSDIPLTAEQKKCCSSRLRILILRQDTPTRKGVSERNALKILPKVCSIKLRRFFNG